MRRPKITTLLLTGAWLLSGLIPAGLSAQSYNKEKMEIWDLDREIRYLTESLEEAYWHYLGSGSYAEFYYFADEWARAYPPTEQRDRAKSDTLAAVYDIYHQLCTPKLPKAICTKEMFQPNHYYPYLDVEYMIVEEFDSTNYKNISRNWTQTSKKILSPFLPEHPEARPLYLAKEYLDALDRFLGNDAERFNKENHIPNRSMEESFARAAALQYLFKISSGHWGGWVYESEPRLYFIAFNKELNWAYVEFGARDQGYCRLYHKEQDEWIEVMKCSSWIQ